jgi:hypothetical protein
MLLSGLPRRSWIQTVSSGWEGTSEGQPGKATVRREYTRVLNSRFVRVHNRSEYPPQDTNPKGEIHEDEGFISFDRARKRLVFRQFHVEGFVNQYLEDADTSPSTVMFTTETIENIPAAGARVKRMWFMGQTSSKRCSSSPRVASHSSCTLERG